MSKFHLITLKEHDHVKNKARLDKHIAKHAAKGKVKKPKMKHELKELPHNFVIEDADDDLLNDLRNDPNIVAVEEDIMRTPSMAQNAPEWSHRLSDIAAFHSRGYTGAGVKVGVIDTGFAHHEDLVYSAKINKYSTTVPPEADRYNHGTMCAGIIGARNNDKGYVGVAPDCLLYVVKADDNTGNKSSMSVSAIIAGIDWLITQGVKIISCSFGSQGENSSERQAFQTAYSKGVLMICAAGNSGDTYGVSLSDCVEYPAKYSLDGLAVAVSCLQSNKEPAAYSSRGPAVSIASPGDVVMTTACGPANQGGDWVTVSSAYEWFNGTSCATPHIAGMAALYKQMYPNYTVDQLRNVLLSNFEDLGKPGKDPVFGVGMATSPWTSRGTYAGKTTDTAIPFTTSISDSIVSGHET